MKLLVIYFSIKIHYNERTTSEKHANPRSDI